MACGPASERRGVSRLRFRNVDAQVGDDVATWPYEALVAARVRAALDRAGTTKGEFAASVGTSASRLSTYLNGKVTPSAALLVRIERIAGSR